MSNWNVLIVDPIGARRTRVARALEKAGDVRIAGTPAEALAAVAEQAPDAIVVSLRQIDGHGLKLARELRGKVPRAWVMVHGVDPALVEKRAEIEAKAGIARYEPRDLEPHEIAAVALAARPRPATASIDDVASPVQLARLQRRFWWQQLWRALVQPRDLIPVRAGIPGGPPSVAEILNGPPSMDNVRMLFRAITGKMAA